MDRRKTTSINAILEQLIKTGADYIANVLAQFFELAMHTNVTAFLEPSTMSRWDYANGSKPKRTHTPASTVTVQFPRPPSIRGCRFISSR